MAGLSHYRSARSAMQKFEPVFLNQFEILFTQLPAGITADPNLTLSQQVKKLSGLEVDKNPGVVDQRYKFAQRRYAGSMPDKTTMDVNVEFEVNLDDNNSMFTFKVLREWSDIVYNPNTGSMGLKSDYAGSMLINIHNKAGDIFRQINCPVCWPSSPITTMELDNVSTNLYTVSVTFAVDYWEDLFL
jgi:hypothetical protein